MMDNNIKFKLAERLWLYDDDKDIVFNAELIDDKYKVTWDDSVECAMYSVQSAEELLASGDWIEIV